LESEVESTISTTRTTYLTSTGLLVWIYVVPEIVFHHLSANTNRLLLLNSNNYKLPCKCGVPVAQSVGRPRSPSLIPGRGNKFVLSTASRPVLEPAQSAIQWVPGLISRGLKRQERTDHSTPSSAEVKSDGVIAPLTDTSSWRDV
jgi:hypothetical protein